MVEKKEKKARDLSEVVVWVEGPRVTPEPRKATINMTKKRFEPHLVVVPVGGSVAFPNMDPILHNAFSVSGKNRFDLQLYRKPQSRAKTFEHPGIVRVYCNIHPQMSAFVVVRDNPFWAQASRDGRFSIADVPPGDWVVRAWHPRAREISQKARVTEEGVVDVALTLDASRFRRVPHKNKHGKKYKKGRY
jgi:plastocyanin